MAFIVCPLCGEGMHGLINMADKKEWFIKYHSDLPMDSVIPSICWDCNYDYAVGQMIVVRMPDKKNIYTITNLISREHQPPLIIAMRPDGTTRHFAVTQVRPYQERQPEIKDSNVVHKPGYF